MFLRILLQSLRVRKSRVFIAFCSVMIGASITTALLSIYFDISIKMNQELKSYGANFFIGSGTSSGSVTIKQKSLEKALELISQEKIIAKSSYIYGVTRLDLGNAVIAGVEFSGFKKLSSYWRVKGRWITVDFDQKHAMVGKSLAKKMELTIGDMVTITNRKLNISKKVKIKGIFESGAAEDEQIFVNLSLAQKVLGMEGKINHTMLSLGTQGMNIDLLADRLEKQLPFIDARPLRKVSYSEGKILGKIEGLLSLVAIMILLATSLCIMTTLVAMVVERSKEIGLMKALGAENPKIVLLFMSETAIIVFLGVIAGSVLGFILAQVIGQSVFNSSISFRFIVLPLTFSISIVTAVIAAIIPVRMTVNILPAQVLKGE
ncbi:MAG: putative ABC transport system permease protein [bacterium]|jgi:putative ABC transport system permease protein